MRSGPLLNEGAPYRVNAAGSPSSRRFLSHLAGFVLLVQRSHALAAFRLLSLPCSPLASPPPDVDVPPPLGLAFIELPTVGDVPGVAELAAGSPMVDPRPLGPPLFEPVWFEPVCANASVLESANTPASAIDENFMIGFLIHSLIPKQTSAALDVP